MSQTPKVLTEISVYDDRGTSITLRLFCPVEPMQTGSTALGFTRELIELWDNEFGGQADRVTVGSMTVSAGYFRRMAYPQKPLKAPLTLEQATIYEIAASWLARWARTEWLYSLASKFICYRAKKKFARLQAFERMINPQIEKP